MNHHEEKRFWEKSSKALALPHVGYGLAPLAMTGTEDSGHKPMTGHSGCSGRIAPQQKSSTV